MDRVSRPDAWRAEFIARQGFRCHYCNRSAGAEIGPDGRAWHIDHKTPLARGGADSEENLVLACKRCNLVKHAQPYKQFQAFARAAFWIPDDGQFSEDELDALMNWWTRASVHGGGDSDPKWRHEIGTSEEPSRVFIIGADGDPQTLLVPPENIPPYRLKEANEAVSLAADMYVALPRLIAEIRILRARLAEVGALWGRCSA